MTRKPLAAQVARFEELRLRVAKVLQLFPEDTPARRDVFKDIALEGYEDLRQNMQGALDEVAFQRQEAAQKGGQAKARKARRRSRARAWLREVEGRRQGLTREAVYAHIDKREGLRSGSVKKAVLRLQARKNRQ